MWLRFLLSVLTRAAIIGRADIGWTKALALVIWIGGVLMFGAFILAVGLHPLNLESIYILEVSLFVVVVFAAAVTQIHGRESEVRIREKLLAIELKLAELAEKTTGQSTGP